MVRLRSETDQHSQREQREEGDGEPEAGARAAYPLRRGQDQQAYGGSAITNVSSPLVRVRVIRPQFYFSWGRDVQAWIVYGLPSSRWPIADISPTSYDCVERAPIRGDVHGETEQQHPRFV